MKKYIKFGGLAVICTVFVTTMSVFGISKADTAEKTLVDYLNDKNMSYLIISAAGRTRLTTFGGQDATKSCVTIGTAGYNVRNIRNFTTEDLIETNASCR